MPRLIDADALSIQVMDASYWDNQDEDVIWNLVQDAPTVDAVEVVRCKDCKHWVCWRGSGEGTGDCHLDEGYSTLATQHYDFCSYGEKREV